MESTLETIYIKRGLQSSFIGDRAVRFREIDVNTHDALQT